MLYFYKFNNNNDKKPSETAICNDCPDGFIMFDDGLTAVKWDIKDHDGNGGLLDVVKPVEPAVLQPIFVPPTATEIAEQRKFSLDHLLSENKTKLVAKIGEGVLTGNDEEITTAKENWSWLTNDYQFRLSEINVGNDPWASGNDGWTLS